MKIWYACGNDLRGDIMKKKFILVLALLLIFSSLNISTSAPSDVAAELKTLNINNQTKSVNVVTVNLSSTDIELEVVTANDGVHGAEDLISMINRKKPIAAINANFFDAYNSLEPYGSIIKNKNFTYMEGENTSLVIKDGNKVEMDRFKSTINGYLDGKTENQWNNNTQSMDFNIFSIWYVNNLPTDNTGVYLYTPTRGTSIWLSTGTAIEVINNTVTRVLKNPQQTTIPSNGYIIYYGPYSAEDNYINSRFKPGRTVSFSHNLIPVGEKTQVASIAPVQVSAKQTKLFGSLDKKTNNNWNNKKNDMDFNLFNIWFINNKPIDSSGVYLYTPERGSTFTVPQGNAVTVMSGEVSKVELQTTTISIPVNGYVIYYGKDAVNDEYITKRFEIGRTVDFYHETSLKIDTLNIMNKAIDDNRAALLEGIGTTASTGLDLNAAEYMITAGPFLVKDGKIIANAIAQGFTEEKITVNRAQRSALGITKDNKLKLVTGNNLNIDELAQVMIALGCERAMNLDGGASSALYAKGKMLTTPGRKLNTVLMIRDKGGF